MMTSLELKDDDEDEKFERMAEQCGARVVASEHWQPATQTTHLVTSPSASFPQLR